MSEHLANAAATLQLLLARGRPEYAWVVQVGERDGDDPARLSPTPLGHPQVCPEGDDTDPVLERRPSAPAARPSDDDGLEKAA